MPQIMRHHRSSKCDYLVKATKAIMMIGTGIATIAFSLMLMNTASTVCTTGNLFAQDCFMGESQSNMQVEQSGGRSLEESGNPMCSLNKQEQMQTRFQLDSNEMGQIFVRCATLIAVLFFAFAVFLFERRVSIEVQINIERDQEDGGGDNQQQVQLQDNIVWAEARLLPSD